MPSRKTAEAPFDASFGIPLVAGSRSNVARLDCRVPRS